MKVPMLSPYNGNYNIQTELKEAVSRVINSGQFICGKEVKEFELACSERLYINECIGVSSGTDALIASLIRFEIGPSDEVIVPSFTFFATAGAVARVGAKPIFADVQPDCFTISPYSLESLVTKKTKAIIPVHLFGQMADMPKIMKFAMSHNLLVIEDACQAFGSDLDGFCAGSLGHVGCFSFFPSKNLGGFGDAGLISTQSRRVASSLRQIRNHGMSEQYQHLIVGGNFRMDEIQAALLKVKLKHLSNYEEHRRFNVQKYREALSASQFYTLPDEVRGKHVWNQFTIKMGSRIQRDNLKDFLSKNEISSAVYYPIPLHKQKCFESNSYCPVSEALSDTVISLPIAPEITDIQIDYTIEKLIEFERNNL